MSDIIDKAPVTVAEYMDFQVAHPEREVPLKWAEQKADATLPVVGVSAYDADAYAAWVGAR